MRSHKPTQVIQIAVILLSALALKYYYSISNVNDLRWILAPTTFLVELVTSTQFRFESMAGYLSDDRTFLIALPCSGVNFLIIAFVMLTLGAIWRESPNTVAWRSLLVSTIVAYFSTLIANTVRIALALKLRYLDLEGTGFNFDEVHRLEGIIVYFVFLLLLFFASDRLARRRGSSREEHRPIIGRLLIPLTIYYGVTLAIPLLRGAFNDQEFWDHAFFVIVTPLIMLLPFVIIDIAKAFESGQAER